MQISDSYTPQGVGPLAPKQPAPVVAGPTSASDDSSSSHKKAKTDSASFSPEALAALAQSQGSGQGHSG